MIAPWEDGSSMVSLTLKLKLIFLKEWESPQLKFSLSNKLKMSLLEDSEIRELIHKPVINTILKLIHQVMKLLPTDFLKLQKIYMISWKLDTASGTKLVSKLKMLTRFNCKQFNQTEQLMSLLKQFPMLYKIQFERSRLAVIKFQFYNILL